ncbi:hypothetical protein KAR91_16570, partial [Candidatus Pacearchaeota archaeon]|nr:hypothetical protein [Candidatus Pacearchaeota archaeon]
RNSIVTLQQNFSDSPEWKLQKARHRTKKRKGNLNLSRYRTEDGIILFVWEVLGVDKIESYQENILRSLIRYKRVAVRGPHGLGKTAVAAWFIIWLNTCHEDDVKVVTTASKWKQLAKFLWPEVRKWVRRADLSKVGVELQRGKELLDMEIKLPGKEAFAVASNDYEAIEGAHAKTIAYIFDEAKAIPNNVFDAAEGAFSTAGEDTDSTAYALMISTPGTAAGRFYEVHKRKPGYEEWHVIHVTLPEVMAAGRISKEWVETRKRQWGEKSSIYKMRVKGEFDTSGEKSVIPLEWVELANDRWYACNGKGSGRRSLGVDPARFGEDKTAIADNVGYVIETIEYYSKQDTMQTTGATIAAIKGDKTINIAVDVDGVGGGVVDRLKELDYNVFGVNAGSKSAGTDISGEIGFRNLRSELWWMTRELLDPANGHDVALPPDDLMTADLTAPTFKYTSSGLIQVESKDDIRVRLGRSTDGADAVMLALYVADIPQMASIAILD